MRTSIIGSWISCGRLLACAAVLFCSVPAAFAHDTGGDSACPCGKARTMAGRIAMDKIVVLDAEPRGGPREAPEATDLLHCDLEIEVVPSSATNIIGTNTMTVKSLVDGLTQFTFRLRSQYNISSATIGGTPVSVSTQSTTTRVATLDRAYNTNETFDLTISYSGGAVSPGFGSIEFTTHSGADIVYTLSEPYYSYTWWPVKDGDFAEPGDNGDKFTLDLAVIAPNGMVSASNGLLQGVDALSGSRERYRWSTDYPTAPYLACFSTTNYNTYQVNYTPIAGGSMPVLFYLYPESDNTTNRNAWFKAVDMMYTLRDYYGEYPFVDEKYGMYQCSFGGGMEHQTFTAQGTFNERVTVHELGHQWWGDMVTCKTWHDIWLNEGFATYTEAIWEEKQPGSSGLPALKASMASKKYTGGGSVYVTTGELSSVGAIFDGDTTYDKAGWVVHMMRHVLGDADFWSMLAAYRTAYEGGAATTADFQAICEGFYPGGDLDWFFQEWVFGEYLPSYAYGWQSVNVNGQDYLRLRIQQTQSGSIQRFTMPIDVRVNGTTDYVVFNDHDPQYFVIPLPTPASTVALDPDAWILTGSITPVSYISGPPKVVQVSPLPGDALACDASLTDVTIAFDTGVNAAAGQFSLVGDATGAAAVSFAYNSGNNTVTLSSATPLPADTYTLTISDALTAIGSSQPLDGEISDPNNPASLPSGNGVAGGAAVLSFTIEARPTADINGDCSVGMDDVELFVDVLLGDETNEPYLSNSDIDGSGLPPNGEDIAAFVAAYLAP